MRILLITLAMVLAVTSCKKVPITGRRQAAFIPSNQINSLSNTSYRQTISESRLSTNQEQVQLVRKVGTDISQAVEKFLRENGYESMISEFSWEFNLIDDPTVNAWCMPGGKVAFYTGILPICRDANGIAVVMGHEIAHAVAKHGNERMTQGLMQAGLGMGLQLALRDQPAQTQAIFNSAFGVASTVGVILPFSRKHESEADRLGLKFMAMAGYDPREAPRFWERMANASSGGSASTASSTMAAGFSAGNTSNSTTNRTATQNNTSQQRPANTNQAPASFGVPATNQANQQQAASFSVPANNQPAATGNQTTAAGGANSTIPMTQNLSNFNTSAFMSTHPSHDRRIRDLNKWMPEALKYYKP
jgi:Zn-dependent protease with chaperone function